MKNGVLVTIDGDPDVINLDMVIRIKPADDATIRAQFCYSSGISVKVDQTFGTVVNKLTEAGIVIDCT